MLTVTIMYQYHHILCHVYVNPGLLYGVEDIVVNVYIVQVVYIECLVFTKCTFILESQMCKVT